MFCVRRFQAIAGQSHLCIVEVIVLRGTMMSMCLSAFEFVIDYEKANSFFV